MGGGNVPRVPYKAPGEQGYQVCFDGLLGSVGERGSLRDANDLNHAGDDASY